MKKLFKTKVATLKGSCNFLGDYFSMKNNLVSKNSILSFVFQNSFYFNI